MSRGQKGGTGVAEPHGMVGICYFLLPAFYYFESYQTFLLTRQYQTSVSKDKLWDFFFAFFLRLAICSLREWDQNCKKVYVLIFHKWL